MNRSASTAYRLAPIWAQNLFLTGYGALLRRQRYGGRFSEYRDLVARTEWLSRGDLEEYQNERLRAVISHAYETVPYYRRRFDERNLKPQDIRGRADLPKIPLLTRDDIRSHFEQLRSRLFSRRGLRTGHTSGTTGTPLTVGYDKDTVWITYAVFDRHYQWAGCRVARDGDRVAVARGNLIVPPAQQDPPFWRFNRQQNQLLLSSFHLSNTNLPAYFNALSQFRPTVIDGYPSTLYVLARFLQRRGETFPIRAAITSSETLYDFQRSLIEERFACRVFDYYALAERTVFSGECEQHRGHHVAMEYGLAEIVDSEGEQVMAGTPGRLVGTTLHNLAMPLIRYVSNDVTALRGEACVCGRGLQMMDDVTTKAEDMLTLKDGRVISPSVLTHPFKPLESIEGSQIIQMTHDEIIVRIVPGPGYRQSLSDHLKTELTARLGSDVRIKVEIVPQLEQTPSGKFKWVISHVPPGV